MNNLYVFAIGGSGERVMKSLMMLLTAGVKINADHVVPVFIDNDVESNALQDCLDLIDYYRSTPRENNKMGAHSNWHEISGDPKDWGTFFSTDVAAPIILNKAGGAIGSLRAIIGNLDNLGSYTDSVLEEEKLLFSEDDLSMPLNVGFVGNPNIGSIVLNSLSLQDEKFLNVLSSISANDGVFVIGSLFGGTGAAGIPLVVNTFNGLNVMSRPTIGVGAILPYFSFDAVDRANKINVEKYDVDSSTFETKTRAALMYYDENMRDLDYMYYVGDGIKDTYGHYNGGFQPNPTHIVEVMTAYSIVDFSKQGHSQQPVYKSPVINENPADHSLNIESLLSSDLKKALVKFQLLKLMFTNDNFLKWAINQKKTYTHNIKFDEAKLAAVNGSYEGFQYSYGLNKLLKAWDKWLEELSSATKSRKFSLFNNSKTTDDANVLENFYSNQINAEFGKSTGLAKTEIHKRIFCDPKLVILPADVSESLERAFSRLNSNTFTVDDDRKILPVLLKTISDALDEVIENKCITL